MALTPDAPGRDSRDSKGEDVSAREARELKAHLLNPSIPQEPYIPPVPDYDDDDLERAGVEPFSTSAPVQTTYPTTQPVGYPGMPATQHGWDADSALVETVAGIAFGVAVSKGTTDKRVIVGGTAAGFKGITYRDITTVNNVSPDVIPRYASAGVMLAGDIWVAVKEAVTPSDLVCFDAATGQLGKTGQSIVGARWMRTQATVGGLNIVRVHSPQAPGATV